MNTKEKTDRQTLIRKTENIKTIADGDTAVCSFGGLYELFSEFLVLCEGVVIPSMSSDSGVIVELSVIDGMRFFEEHRIDDFMRQRIDSVRFVDWALKNRLKDALVRSLRPPKNPK